MWARVAVPLPQRLHPPQVAAAEQAQVRPTDGTPRQFETHHAAAPRLDRRDLRVHRLRREQWGGGCRRVRYHRAKWSIVRDSVILVQRSRQSKLATSNPPYLETPLTPTTLTSADDWRPTAALSVLQQRAIVLDCVRRFFIARGYWEVETPLLSRDTCVDTWIDPVMVAHPLRSDQSLYLQTSPEFAMKRLLAAGAEAIFEITRSFRQGESGPRHNLEFTIVEWYRVGDSHYAQMRVVEELVREVASVELGDVVSARQLAFPAGEFPRVTYDEAARAGAWRHRAEQGDARVATARGLLRDRDSGQPPGRRP